jgi:putative oxidoreductase
MNTFDTIPNKRSPFMTRVDGVGQWLAPLGLRAILGWEFFEAGHEKLTGQNWFVDAADKFPVPFSLLSPSLNWTLATWIELLGSIALVVGLGTRYVASALFVLTVVAIYAVHWPSDWSSLSELWQGYAITNEGFGNYKLPLIYLLMLLPLMLNGAGRLSVDHFIAASRGGVPRTNVDARAFGVVTLAIGVTTSLLLPWFGGALAIAGLLLAAWPTARPAVRTVS